MILQRHGGRPLVKALSADAIIGKSPDLVVVVEFPSSDAAKGAFEDLNTWT